MWLGRPALLCFLWCVQTAKSGGGTDLEEELYKAAVESKHMSALSQETIDDFLANAPEPYVLVLFHVGTCHICRDSLPSLDSMAQEWKEKGKPIHVAHVEATTEQEYWKNRFGFKGFPHLYMWHRPDKKLGQLMKPLFDLQKSSKSSASRKVTVTKSEADLLAAARGANMGHNKDKLRLAGLGQAADVLKIELDDFTAKLNLGGKGGTWFPLEALSTADGKPLMNFKRPDFPIDYRPSGWGKADMQDFAERLLRPTIETLTDMAQLVKEMKDEKMAALVLCAADVGKSPAFADFAKSWKDKHRSYLATSKEACPVSGGTWPQLVVYSARHQQWSAGKGKAVPAAAVAGPEILSQDKEAISTWFMQHRYPGFWTVSYENFHTLIHAGRNTALIAIDEAKKGETRKVEQQMRDIAKPTPSETKDGLEVYSYAANSTYWGVVDGHLNGLSTFGISSKELPRVVVFEDEYWVEDVDELSIWNLTAGLATRHQLVRYGGGGIQAFLMQRLYKPWADADKWANKVGGNPLRACLLFSMVVGFIMGLVKLGRLGMWVFKATLGGVGESDDGPVPTGAKKPVVKKNN